MNKRPLIALLMDECLGMSADIPQAAIHQLNGICQREGTDEVKAARQHGAMTAAVLAGIVIGVIASRDYIRVSQFREEDVVPGDLEDLVRCLSPVDGEPMVLKSPVTDEMISDKLREFEDVYKKAN